MTSDTQVSPSRRSFLGAGGVGVLAAVASSVAVAEPASATTEAGPEIENGVLFVDRVTPVPSQSNGLIGDTDYWLRAVAIAVATPAVHTILGQKAQYLIRGTISLNGLTNITISGAGLGKTTFLQGSSTSVEAVFKLTASANDVTFTDFSIDAGLSAVWDADKDATITQAEKDAAWNRPTRTARRWPSDVGIRKGISIGGASDDGSVNITNVTVRNVSFFGTKEFPVLISGTTGVATIVNCHFERCLDVGFTFNEKVVFTGNTVLFSADNGVSISRGNKQALCESNTIIESFYSGVLAGGNIISAEYGPGHDGDGSTVLVTIRDNTIDGAGQYGIDLSLAPRNVLATNNVIRNAKLGVALSGWRQDIRQSYTENLYADSLAAIPDYVVHTSVAIAGSSPSQYKVTFERADNGSYVASNITITQNTIIDCWRGGVAVTYADDVTVSSNTISFTTTTAPISANTTIKRGVHRFGISNIGSGDQLWATATGVLVNKNVITDSRSADGLLDGIYYFGAPTGTWTLTDNVVLGAVRPLYPAAATSPN